MTTNATEMSTPVTHGELRAELERFETRFDHKLEQLETRFDEKLEIWGGALLDRIESVEQRLLTELADRRRTHE